MCCSDPPSGMSLSFSQLTALSLSRNFPLLKEADLPSLIPPLWGQPTSIGASKGLASCLNHLQRTTPLRQRLLLQPHRRLTSLSAHLCFRHPTQMLFLRVLPNTPSAHKSWSLRICFLGYLTYNIYYVSILRLFPML